jgi:hypothetical protein
MMTVSRHEKIALAAWYGGTFNLTLRNHNYKAGLPVALPATHAARGITRQILFLRYCQFDKLTCNGVEISV